MSIQGVWQKSFDFLGTQPIVVEPSAGQLTSDAGLLPIRQFDEQIGLTEQFAGALDDRRHEPFVDHSFLQMVRMRVFGILADYPDQNDHDRLGRFYPPREFQVSVCHW
ncbi:MAG: transposase [Planctomycetes bacterium]|nr:transposase [Planctomycetota bacterium]